MNCLSSFPFSFFPLCITKQLVSLPFVGSHCVFFKRSTVSRCQPINCHTMEKRKKKTICHSIVRFNKIKFAPNLSVLSLTLSSWWRLLWNIFQWIPGFLFEKNASFINNFSQLELIHAMYYRFCGVSKMTCDSLL